MKIVESSHKSSQLTQCVATGGIKNRVNYAQIEKPKTKLGTMQINKKYMVWSKNKIPVCNSFKD